MNHSTTAADRGRLIAEKISQLQRDDPKLTYDAAWRACEQLPEMREVFAAMQRPAHNPADAATFGVTKADEAKRLAQSTAGARFSGIVQAAVNARGISWDQAWTAMRAEQPDLYAEMRSATMPDTRTVQPLDFMQSVSVPVRS